MLRPQSNFLHLLGHKITKNAFQMLQSFVSALNQWFKSRDSALRHQLFRRRATWH